MVHIHVRVGILGPLMGFDPSGPSQWGCWAKSHGTHNAPLLARLEKYRIFYLFVVGNGGSLMLMCSNVHVSEGFLFFL